MFELLEYTEARLATLTSRSEKHGDDEVPAVSLGLEMSVGNRILDLIDPELRQTFYRAPDTQTLPGVSDELTALRCNSIERAIVSKKYEGWTLHIDDGADESEAAEFVGCKVDKISVEPMNGGTVTLRMRVGTSDLDAERSGMLAMHIGQPIWITLTAPKIAPAPTREAEPDATDLFVAGADAEAAAGKR